MTVAVAVAMALVAAIMFAVAAVAQNTAIAGVVADRVQALRAAEFRGLARSRTWLCGVALTAVASVVHAGALVLAPVAVVQPIGVLSVPIAITLAAWRTRMSPPAAVWAAVLTCLSAVIGYVVLADAGLGTHPLPDSSTSSWRRSLPAC
jgi:hypothetical protein